RSGLGGRLRRRHVRPVHAGRARPLRLLPLLLLAGAGAGLADELPELDADLRRGGPGLGEDRPRVPMIAGLATLALLAQAPPTSTGAPVTTGGTSFYLRMWPDQFVKFDPATDTVVKSLKNHHGTGYDVELSWDRKRVFQVTGQRSFVEIVDLATM